MASRVSRGTRPTGVLGTIPETLSRIFARMSGDGLIEVDGRDIRLIDREGLAELAGMDLDETL
jgi:CRP/FNR family transcriptional regulator